MIGTAFYVLGVIACMISIVVAAVAGIALVIAALPYMVGFGLLALALWILGMLLDTPVGAFFAKVLIACGMAAGAAWLVRRMLTL
jgi:hypothetical protein